MTRILIGVIGPGETATVADMRLASSLGAAIANQNWALLTGGRAAGVMDAVSQGARAAGGLVIGILPGETREQMSSAIDIPILTGMGQGRNVINVLSSRIIIACGCGPGTLAEMALAMKLGRPLILLNPTSTLVAALSTLAATSPIAIAPDVPSAISQTQRWLNNPPTISNDGQSGQSSH